MLAKLNIVFSWIKNNWKIVVIGAVVLVVGAFMLWVNAKLNRIDELEGQVFQLQTQVQLTALQVQEAGKKEELKVLADKYIELDKKIQALKKAIDEDKLPANITTEEIVNRFKQLFP